MELSPNTNIQQQQIQQQQRRLSLKDIGRGLSMENDEIKKIITYTRTS